jgi:hypothetical protein
LRGTVVDWHLDRAVSIQHLRWGANNWHLRGTVADWHLDRAVNIQHLRWGANNWHLRGTVADWHLDRAVNIQQFRGDVKNWHLNRAVNIQHFRWGVKNWHFIEVLKINTLMYKMRKADTWQSQVSRINTWCTASLSTHQSNLPEFIGKKNWKKPFQKAQIEGNQLKKLLEIFWILSNILRKIVVEGMSQKPGKPNSAMHWIPYASSLI